ncbi:polysaccharide deacetylase family protein [Candidatus Nomurabacteria bacterium]|nr:polysaccharide deacetylase family protein [Candidatus Nomurabacteria bacterium]
MLALGGLFFISGCQLAPANEVHPESTNERVVIEEVPVAEPEIPLQEIGESFDLPIFAYHHIGSPPDNASESTKTWYVSLEDFEADMRYLKDNGYVPLFSVELIEYLGQEKLPQKAVMVTFDDGAIDFYENAWPILKKYEVKSIMHLQSHVHSKNWLSDDQIQELDQTDMVEFGSHTKYHAYLTRISAQEAEKEINESKERIENVLEKEIHTIAYPFGLYNEDVIELAKKAGYDMAFTIESGIGQQKNELYKLKRIIITGSKRVEDVLGK